MATQRGFTLVELTIVMAVLGILAMTALTLYANLQGRARVAKAQADLKGLHWALVAFGAHCGDVPNTATAFTDVTPLVLGAAPDTCANAVAGASRRAGSAGRRHEQRPGRALLYSGGEHHARHRLDVHLHADRPGAVHAHGLPSQRHHESDHGALTSMAMVAPLRRGKIGELLVTEGVITPKQLQDALNAQSRLENYALLGHVLVAGKVVTREQLKRVLQLHRRSPRLGEILVNSRSITATQLTQALAEQGRTGLAVGETLVRLGHATERQVRRALCMQLNIEFIELNPVLLDPELKLVINARFAIKHLVVPLARIGGTLVVAMDDPTQAEVVADLRSSTGLNIEVITSTTGAIRQALDTLYTGPARLGDGARVAPPIANEPNVFALEDIGQLAPEAAERAKQTEALDARSGFESANETLRAVLRVAINHGASDIHLEMVDRRMRPRFRIDGVLQELPLGVLG